MKTIINFRESDDSIQKTFDQLFYEYFWNNKKNIEVYNWINHDNGEIIVSNTGKFWIEKSYSGAGYPNSKAFESIKRFCKKY